jgi:hypothetical protein
MPKLGLPELIILFVIVAIVLLVVRKRQPRA